MYSRLAIFYILLISYSAHNQTSKEVFPHFVSWNKIEITQIFEDKPWGIGIDGIARFTNEMGKGHPFQRLYRSSLRPWFHYQLGADARLSVSPISFHTTEAYIGLDEDFDTPSQIEFRNSIQFFHHLKQSNGRIMHTWRYRFALRHRLTEGSDDWVTFARFRTRYRIRYMLNAPDLYTPGVIYATASAELGINFGAPVVYNTFNQNRIYLGVGFRVFNAARIELRYVDRIRARGTGYQFDYARGVMIALNIDQLTYLGKRYTQPIKYAD
jgi:hypothetical protein